MPRKPTNDTGIEPRLMTRRQAATYCQVSEPTFTARCPVAPVKMGESVRMYRWDRRSLDRWLDTLDTENPSLTQNHQDWLDRLGEGHEGRRAGD